MPDTRQEESYVTGDDQKARLRAECFPKFSALSNLGLSFLTNQHFLAPDDGNFHRCENSPSVKGRLFGTAAGIVGTCQSAALIPSHPLQMSRGEYSGRREDKYGRGRG